MQLSGTVAPWLVGGFAVLSLVMLAQTLKAWREAKRSPYFFQRLQAQKRLRQYSSASLAMILLTTGVAAYGWHEPVEDVSRSAILINNKPVAAASLTQPEDSADAQQEPAPVLILDPTSALIDNPASSDSATTSAAKTLALPAEYNDLTAEVELQDDTALGSLSFSTRINNQYDAINPGRTFSVGFFTLYATFAYDGMENGMVWSWVWMRDGVVVSGGNEMWQYGNDGPGYVFLNPEEGFAAGQYTLGVWVNGELMGQGTFQITTSAASQR